MGQQDKRTLHFYPKKLNMKYIKILSLTLAALTALSLNMNTDAALAGKVGGAKGRLQHKQMERRGSQEAEQQNTNRSLAGKVGGAKNSLQHKQLSRRRSLA